MVITQPELLQEAVEKVHLIQKKMKPVQDRQKGGYADKRRKKLEFQVSDLAFLRVSPSKSVVCFGVVGKLKPCDIGPFKILEAYALQNEKDY